MIKNKINSIFLMIFSIGNPGLGSSVLALSRFVSDITYTTKDNTKQAHISKIASSFLPIFHLHCNARLISIRSNRLLS